MLARCEGCGAEVAQNETTYASTGELVCRTCDATNLTTAATDDLARHQRAARNGLIASIVALIAIPTLTVTLGGFDYLAAGLLGLGLLMALGGRAALGTVTGSRGVLGALVKWSNQVGDERAHTTRVLVFTALGAGVFLAGLGLATVFGLPW